jgi:hypothetical protein
MFCLPGARGANKLWELGCKLPLQAHKPATLAADSGLGLPLMKKPAPYG